MTYRKQRSSDKHLNKMENLTQLEASVLESIKYHESNGWEMGVCAEDIADQIKVNTKSIRGVFSSLIKKELIAVESLVQGCPPFAFSI